MQTQQTRRTRIGKHLRRNVVAYVALMLAVTMSPLPSWAAGKIGTSDLKNNAVTSKKIANNTIKGKDIKAGGVKTSDLADAAVTAAKLGTVTTRESRVDVANNSGGFAQVQCAAGEVLLGGGAQASGVGLSSGWDMIRNGPIDNGWDAAVYNDKGSVGELIVQAICLAP